MLKKSTILFALLFISAKAMNAQTLSIGPMVGVNVSSVTDSYNTKGLVGASLGGFANYSVNEHIGIGVKILYSQLGTAFTDVTLIHRLNYVQIPVTGIYYFGQAGDKFRPKIFAGAYYGSLLKATLKNGDEVLNLDGQTTYNKVDIGALGGIGFNYLVGSRTWLNVDAGYNQGFSDLTRNTDTAHKNSALSLNVGISFPIGN
ncbi:MAG: porin family protein [Bacteroidota bacterium]